MQWLIAENLVVVVMVVAGVAVAVPVSGRSAEFVGGRREEEGSRDVSGANSHWFKTGQLPNPYIVQPVASSGILQDPRPELSRWRQQQQQQQAGLTFLITSKDYCTTTTVQRYVRPCGRWSVIPGPGKKCTRTWRAGIMRAIFNLDSKLVAPRGGLRNSPRP